MMRSTDCHKSLHITMPAHFLDVITSDKTSHAVCHNRAAPLRCICRVLPCRLNESLQTLCRHFVGKTPVIREFEYIGRTQLLAEILDRGGIGIEVLRMDGGLNMEQVCGRNTS